MSDHLQERPFRIIIAGGRDMDDTDFGFSHISHLLQNLENELMTIVDGTAKGADTVGRLWGEKEDGVSVKHFKPDWSQGKTAGFKRNKEMAEYGTHLIAFWDENSRGTKHMIDNAKRLGLEVKIIPYRRMIVEPAHNGKPAIIKCVAPEVLQKALIKRNMRP